ncbi:MAG: lysophospholipid acyltransferase family protein [Phycisphaerae bacterium]|nr:lysophospholipid acyltransferase family protein [Phycisphaerae bacterium]
MGRPLGQSLNNFGLRIFFRLASICPGAMRWLKRPFVRIAFAASPTVRKNTGDNARVIFGDSITPAETRRFGRGVLGYFFDFVLDISYCQRATRQQLAKRIAGIEGHDRYVATRQARRGAILLTAHMGSFELGIVALQEFESHIHVVFKRDAIGGFETLRGNMRQRLGVHEAPIDDGWPIWVRLRDSLRNDDVVLVQGDRVMPGQRGIAVPFLHGRLMLPTGPVKLAAASGAPIVAVFCVRDPDGRVRLHIDEAIHVPEQLTEEAMIGAMSKIAGVLERYVRQHPQQWLVLNSAFCEHS